MGNPAEDRPHNPKLLRNRLFSACKRWLAISLTAKLFVFGVGIASVWFSLAPDKVPYIVATLMFCSEVCMWRSDFVKGVAEALHRKLDYENSFGWIISRVEISDILARVNCDLNDLKDHETGSNFFASSKDPGSLRAAENLQESAWWSKHLAESMWITCLIVMLLLVLSSIILLIVSINTVKDFAVLANVGKVVTAAILLIFSLGLFRFTMGYFAFARRADKIEEGAKSLVTHPAIDHVDILKLWQDYQLARAAAPVIPTWMWKLRERKLNELWRNYRV